MLQSQDALPQIRLQEHNGCSKLISYLSLDGFSWQVRSDAGGERAAAIYSLLGSAKLNGIDPEASLGAVLRRIADHPINRIAELLPWNLFPAKSPATEAA